MRKILALDVGDKRVGVAISTEGSGIASVFGCFERAGGRAEGEILRLIDKENVFRLVVGLPLSDDGAENPQCAKVRAFCKRIIKRSPVELTFVDEYLSSVEAEQRLRDEGRVDGRAISKGAIDEASAALILQSFLDNDSTKGRR